MCRTPKLRHAVSGNWGHFSVYRCHFIDKQSPSRGSVEILKGFPRPVGAVGNLPLVFHRSHQRRHFLRPRFPAQTLPVSDNVMLNAAFAGYMLAPRTRRQTNQVTDRTYPLPAQQQLHKSNGSPSTLIQRPVRFVSHPNRPKEEGLIVRRDRYLGKIELAKDQI
jgi:hypothetical protein